MVKRLGKQELKIMKGEKENDRNQFKACCMLDLLSANEKRIGENGLKL